MSATDIAKNGRDGPVEQFASDRPTSFKSLTAAVASALQNDLVTGRYLPGAKLPIVKLARDYGVSPGAVREALSRLVSENLVEFNEQRGFRAAPVSRAALFDIARTRVRVDAHALRDAIRLGDVDWEPTSWRCTTASPIVRSATISLSACAPTGSGCTASSIAR